MRAPRGVHLDGTGGGEAAVAGSTPGDRTCCSAIVSGGAFLASFDGAAVAVALPSISRSLGLGLRAGALDPHALPAGRGRPASARRTLSRPPRAHDVLRGRPGPLLHRLLRCRLARPTNGGCTRVAAAKARRRPDRDDLGGAGRGGLGPGAAGPRPRLQHHVRLPRCGGRPRARRPPRRGSGVALDLPLRRRQAPLSCFAAIRISGARQDASG